MIPPLPEHLTNRGGNPDLLAKELLHKIEEAIDAHPRSQQVRIGPSEIGTSCARRIGYKLLDHPAVNKGPAAWLPQIGTYVHAGLEGVLDGDNAKQVELGFLDSERWLVETRVNVGEINGQAVDGSSDVYDRVTATVVDWKIIGSTSMKKYRAKGPGEQYRAQAHLYGRGFVRAGYPVDTVMIAFLPRNGPLSGAYFWHEPYDEQIAIDALSRAEGIALATQAVGVKALDMLPTADSYCSFCPWHKKDSQDLEQGCPGDPASSAAKPKADPFADIFGKSN